MLSHVQYNSFTMILILAGIEAGVTGIPGGMAGHPDVYG
jgi:hypothetical protein